MKITNISTKEVKNSVIIKVNTLQEAKEKIYSEIQNGRNFKDVVQTKYDINGNIKSFNIAQLSKIKAEFEPKIEENRFDEDKAEVFKLFQKGLSPIEVVIKTKFSFDFVKQSWNEYADVDDKRIVPKRFFYELKKTFSSICAPYNEDLKVYLGCAREITSYAQDGINCSVNCSICGEPMEMEGRMLEDAKEYLSKKWHHDNCVN